MLFFLLAVFLAVVYLGCLVRLVRETHPAGLKLGVRKVKGITVGRKCGFSVYSPYQREDHVIVVGGSGSGKTAAVLIPTLRSWVLCENAGHFTIDISGDISKNVKDPDALIYEPLADSTIKYNVFGVVDGAESVADKVQALNNIALALIPKRESEGTSKYYENAGRDVLSAVLTSGYFTGRDFPDIAEKVVSSDPRGVLNWIDECNISEAVKTINQFVDLEGPQISNIIQGASEALLIFTHPAIKHSLGRGSVNEISITPKAIEKRNIYLIIPDDTKEQYAGLVSIVVGQMLAYMSARPLGMRRKILITIDEFGSFPSLNISETVQKVRKRGGRVMICLQSLARLDRNYGVDTRRDMVSNFRLQLVCEEQDYTAQELYSKQSGTVIKRKHKRGADWNRYSERIEKVRFRPEDFGRLNRKLIVFARGRCFRLRKAYYFDSTLKSAFKSAFRRAFVILKSK